jgi:hypothetical protein
MTRILALQQLSAQTGERIPTCISFNFSSVGVDTTIITY